ncbi:universal stress protein, partial [Streptomyces albidoflavus]|uniref:universal stress protein n=1 Tax=Streptomyces albidoflavus TaxID=1886 RepID=UPI00211C02B4
MSTLPVIAAVDGSDDSTRALEWALEEARLREAPLRIVHAVRTATPRGAEPPAGAAAPDSSVIVETRQALTGRPGLPELSFTTLDSTAASILPELGAEAQLLVLGSRGRGGFASLLLGSNGMACARDADSPVVVAPRPLYTSDAADEQPCVALGGRSSVTTKHTNRTSMDTRASRAGHEATDSVTNS